MLISFFIIYWQRANTYQGDKFSINFNCNVCGEESTYDFDISNLNIEEIKDDYELYEALETPIGKKKIKLTQMRVSDELAMEDKKR